MLEKTLKFFQNGLKHEKKNNKQNVPNYDRHPTMRFVFTYFKYKVNENFGPCLDLAILESPVDTDHFM